MPTGRGIWLWDNDEKIATLEPAHQIPIIEGLGFSYVIPQMGLAVPSWATPDRVRQFNEAGFDVIIGIGSPGPSHADAIVNAIVIGIEACLRSSYPCRRVMYDWESAWDQAKVTALQIVAAVRKRFPGMQLLPVIDCPWWAPVEDPQGHATHPNAPTKEFGSLCCGPRAVQAYGAPKEGRSSAMLGWARHEYSTHFPGNEIIPGVQMYKRSVRDHLLVTLHEPQSISWDSGEIDHTARVAYMLDVAIQKHPVYASGRSQGLDVKTSIMAMQRALGVTADGDPAGPETAKALRVPFPLGVLWRGDWTPPATHPLVS